MSERTLERMRSAYDDNNQLTGSDEESLSDNNESTMKNSDSKKNQTGSVLNKNSDDYKKRRQRNNEAVRKSRERAKKNYAITEARVIKLRKENHDLELEKDGKTKELNVLQELARSLNLPCGEIE